MIELFWQRSESAIEELEDRQVYRDADYTVYDVTHLFYTDLESYGRNVAARMEAGNAGYYYDGQCLKRMDSVCRYYQENLDFYRRDDGQQGLPRCLVSGQPDGDTLARAGLTGVLESDCDIEEVIFTLYKGEDEKLWQTRYVPQDPRRYELAQAAEVTERILALEPGMYSLDVSVELDSQAMGHQTVCGWLFPAGRVQGDSGGDAVDKIPK